MKISFQKPIFHIALLVLLAAYIFFFQLGGLALTDPDEVFYAQTAREMLERGEWVTPYIFGEAQFEKPILYYFLVETSLKFFGVNEFAARLPSAIFGLAGLIGIYLLGWLLFNKRVGLFSGLILATNVEYIILSRACVTDMTLFTLMLFGVLSFFYAYLKDKGHYYILSAVFFALAVLTKGPIAIMLPGFVVIVYLFWIRDLRALRKISLVWAILTFLAVAAPWYLWMYKLHGKVFIDAFFGFQNITRFMTPEHKTGSQFYYNIPIVFGGFFPWSAFLPLGMWRMFRKGQGEKKHSVFLLLWFFVIFLFFSASSTKLPTYIFPSFISLAVMVAVFWDDLLKSSADRKVLRQMRFSYYLLLFVMILGATGVLVFIKFDYPSMLIDVAASLVFLILGMVLSLFVFMRGRYLATFFMIIFAVAVFLYPLSQLVLPGIEPHESSKGISLKLSALMKEGEALGSESNYARGLAFYTGKFPVDLDKHHILVQFLSSRDRVWCVLKEKNHRELYELDTKPYYTKPSYVVYKMDKKCIITNKMPEDGKYLLKRERKR